MKKRGVSGYFRVILLQLSCLLAAILGSNYNQPFSALCWEKQWVFFIFLIDGLFNDPTHCETSWIVFNEINEARLKALDGLVVVEIGREIE